MSNGCSEIARGDYLKLCLCVSRVRVCKMKDIWKGGGGGERDTNHFNTP